METLEPFRIDISEPMTLDQVIDKAREYFELGRGRCTSDTYTSICSYRRKDGHSCVFGAFIPDELATPQLVARNLAASAVLNILHKDGGEVAEYGLPKWMTELENKYLVFTRLQKLHDHSSYWEGNKFVALDKVEALRNLPPQDPNPIW